MRSHISFPYGRLNLNFDNWDGGGLLLLYSLYSIHEAFYGLSYDSKLEISNLSEIVSPWKFLG